MTWGIVGSLPGPIIMGRLMDSTCKFKQQTCSTDGDACVLTDNDTASVKYMVFGECDSAALVLLLVHSVGCFPLRCVRFVWCVVFYLRTHGGGDALRGLPGQASRVKC